MHRGILALMLMIALGVAAWCLPADAPVKDRLSQPPKVTKTRVVSMVSCAAAACHGDANVPTLTQGEVKNHWSCSATHWLAVDPHARAYAALEGELADKIATQLKAGPNGTKLPATQDLRCLACHTTPTLAVPNPSADVVQLQREGVTCTACHGEATDWLSPHTSWKSTRAASMTGTGFVDLNNLKTRADTCAGCHIGAPAKDGLPVRDMNHDMIAAGHPPLDYTAHERSNLYFPTKTYTALQERLLPHWAERAREGTVPVDGTAAMTSAGATAYEALTQSRQSRKDTDARTPWPEFADRTPLSGIASRKSNECWHCHQTVPAKDVGSSGLNRP